MFSLTYFILHTALIILAFIFPQYIFTFYWITFALIYNLYCRRFYRTMHINRSSLRIIHFLPIVFVAIVFKAAENMTNALLNIILFTYAIVIIIHYVVPIVKYLKLRITLYRHVQKLIKEKNDNEKKRFTNPDCRGAVYGSRMFHGSLQPKAIRGPKQRRCTGIRH